MFVIEKFSNSVESNIEGKLFELGWSEASTLQASNVHVDVTSGKCSYNEPLKKRI